MTDTNPVVSSPTDVNAPAVSLHSAAQLHQVAHGDTLSAIAARYGVSVDELVAANSQIENPDLIYPGDQLVVPESGSATVQSGDTLTDIAERYGTSVQAIVDANDIDNPDLIYPGDVLHIQGLATGVHDDTGELPVQNPSDAGGITDPQVPAVPGNTAGTDAVEQFDYDQIQGLANNPNVTPAFIAEVEAMAERLGARPEHLLAVMSFETGGSFSPSESNFIGATGLMQFIPDTARGLGTSTAQLARMSSVEQLEFVEKYFAQPQYAGKLGTLEGVYSSVLSGTTGPEQKTSPDQPMRRLRRVH